MTTTTRSDLQVVTFDLYRDVHKGIRSELFAVTEEAGRLDAAQVGDRAALAAHIRDVVEMLVAHAGHEELIQPAITEHLATLAEQIESDHSSLEARLHELASHADAVVDGDTASQRWLIHDLYLGLASFTTAYLAHQDLEERVVMPALEAAIGVAPMLALHEAILASIPLERLIRFLAVMLPAMNVDDCTELLGGMQAGAPADVFERIWSLAGSVLPAADHATLAARLGLR